MMPLHKLQHDLNREFHNIMSILKFIKKDEELKDADIQEMLDLALQREDMIIQILGELSAHSNVTSEKKVQHEISSGNY